MAIRKKINKKDVVVPTADEFIDGVDVKHDDDNNRKKTILLRIPNILNDKIEKILLKRTVPITRHQWIVEAVAEKVTREYDWYLLHIK